MKKAILLNILKLYVVLALVSFAKAETPNNNTAGEFSPVEPNRISEILTMISNRTKSNYEQIKGWQGKLEVVTDYVYEGDRAQEAFTKDIKSSEEAPKKLLEHRETNIEFSLDAENELLYAKYYSDSAKPLKYIDFESGRDLEAKGTLATRRAILTPEYQIDCLDTKLDGVVISRRTTKQQACLKNNSTCTRPPVYDPRRSLSIGEQIWEFFPMLVEQIKEHGKYSAGEYDLQVEESKTGDTNDYRIIMPSRIRGDENYLFHKMVFSGDKGFNVVSLETFYHNEKDSSNITFKKEIMEFERFDNVYIPCYKLEQTFHVLSGKLYSEKKLVFKNQKINKPIPAETFTYKNLGLKNGDKLVDRILDKDYTYQDGELTLTSKNK